MEVNKELSLLILTTILVISFWSSSSIWFSHGFNHGVYKPGVLLIFPGLDTSKFHVACSEPMIRTHKHRTCAGVHRSPCLPILTVKDT